MDGHLKSCSQTMSQKTHFKFSNNARWHQKKWCSLEATGSIAKREDCKNLSQNTPYHQEKNGIPISEEISHGWAVLS